MLVSSTIQLATLAALVYCWACELPGASAHLRWLLAAATPLVLARCSCLLGASAISHSPQTDSLSDGDSLFADVSSMMPLNPENGAKTAAACYRSAKPGHCPLINHKRFCDSVGLMAA
jgi:hypothetical protein